MPKAKRLIGSRINSASLSIKSFDDFIAYSMEDERVQKNCAAEKAGSEINPNRLDKIESRVNSGGGESHCFFHKRRQKPFVPVFSINLEENIENLFLLLEIIHANN